MKVYNPNDNWDLQPLVVVIYGDPGVGKTTFAATSESPIIFDFDYGAHRSGKSAKIVRFSDWREMATEWEEIKQIILPHQTIVVDTVDTLLESVRTYLVQKDPRLEKNALKRFGELRDEFSGWVQLIRGLQKDLILISHCKEREEGDFRIKRPAVVGQSYDKVMQLSDFVGYMSIVNQQRIVNFDPSDLTVGKNPTRTPAAIVPDVEKDPNYLATLMASWKSILFSGNKINIEEIYRGYETVIEFNVELERLRNLNTPEAKKHWETLKRIAIEAGLQYDNTKKEFIRK